MPKESSSAAKKPQRRTSTAKPARTASAAKAPSIAEISAAFEEVIAPLRETVLKFIETMEARRAAPAVAALAAAAPAAASVESARLDALLHIFSGRGAQQVLQDMLDTGNAPTRVQLLCLADEMISRNTRRSA